MNKTIEKNNTNGTESNEEISINEHIDTLHIENNSPGKFETDSEPSPISNNKSTLQKLQERRRFSLAVEELIMSQNKQKTPRQTQQSRNKKAISIHNKNVGKKRNFNDIIITPNENYQKMSPKKKAKRRKPMTQKQKEEIQRQQKEAQQQCKQNQIYDRNGRSKQRNWNKALEQSGIQPNKTDIECPKCLNKDIKLQRMPRILYEKGHGQIGSQFYCDGKHYKDVQEELYLNADNLADGNVVAEELNKIIDDDIITFCPNFNSMKHRDGLEFCEECFKSLMKDDTI